MKRKGIIYGVVFLFIIFFIYFGYKIFNFCYYNVDTNSYNELKFADSMKINKKAIDENEYLVFKNIKIKNDFKDFKIMENQSKSDENIKYALYDKDGKVKKSFWMGKETSYIKKFKDEVAELFNNKISRDELDNYFKKHNINNDYDLINYLINAKDLKVNIFTNLSELKENYITYNIINNCLPTIASLTLVNGDYNGYIFNINDKILEVNIIVNNEKYFFTFLTDEKISYEYLNDILNTIVIE